MTKQIYYVDIFQVTRAGNIYTNSFKCGTNVVLFCVGFDKIITQVNGCKCSQK